MAHKDLTLATGCTGFLQCTPQQTHLPISDTKNPILQQTVTNESNTDGIFLYIN